MIRGDRGRSWRSHNDAVRERVQAPRRRRAERDGSRNRWANAGRHPSTGRYRARCGASGGTPVVARVAHLHGEAEITGPQRTRNLSVDLLRVRAFRWLAFALGGSRPGPQRANRPEPLHYPASVRPGRRSGPSNACGDLAWRPCNTRKMRCPSSPRASRKFSPRRHFGRGPETLVRGRLRLGR